MGGYTEPLDPLRVRERLGTKGVDIFFVPEGGSTQHHSQTVPHTLVRGTTHFAKNRQTDR